MRARLQSVPLRARLQFIPLGRLQSVPLGSIGQAAYVYYTDANNPLPTETVAAIHTMPRVHLSTGRPGAPERDGLVRTVETILLKLAAEVRTRESSIACDWRMGHRALLALTRPPFEPSRVVGSSPRTPPRRRRCRTRLISRRDGASCVPSCARAR